MIFGVLFFVSLSTIGTPINLNSTNPVSNKILNNSFNRICIPILDLKNKYPELNDLFIATSVVNSFIDKLVQDGRIPGRKNSNVDVCLRDLFKAIVICIKTSTNYAALGDCLRAAYAQYVICKQQ